LSRPAFSGNGFSGAPGILANAAFQDNGLSRQIYFKAAQAPGLTEMPL
jgi:hypothetical protein